MRFKEGVIIFSILKTLSYTFGAIYLLISFLDIFTGFTQLFFGADNSLGGMALENPFLWAVFPVVIFTLGYLFERRVKQFEGQSEVPMREELKEGNRGTSWALGTIAIILLVFLVPDFIRNLLPPSGLLNSSGILNLLLIIGLAILAVVGFKSRKVTPGVPPSRDDSAQT